MKRIVAVMFAACAFAAPPASGRTPPAPQSALFTDPPHDVAHPARSEVLHIPTGGVAVNGLAYIPAGPGLHPVVVLMHGLPGNEKNLDLAQTLRRAGWTVVTFNYRGSWGSPGRFSFRGDLQDARAILAYLRDPANAARLQADPSRIVVAGHSMGGWVAAMTAAGDPDVIGAVLISAADMAAAGRQPRAKVLALAHENRETLAGVSDADMADELAALGPGSGFPAAERGLARHPLLVLSADDGLAPGMDALVADLRALGDRQVTAVHVATDHSWNDARIRLETEILTWLSKLPGAPRS